MPNLTDPLAALELVHALLSKSTDALTQEGENTSSKGKTSVSVHTDTALTPTDTPTPSVSAVSAPSVHTLTQENAVLDDKNALSVSVSVQLGDRELQPDPRADLIRRLLEAGSALGWSKTSLEGWQSWATTAPLQALTERVENTERRLSLRRDSDLEGCPVHWWPVPELPPKGSQVALVDGDGYGCLYRFKVNGRWYLLKFLPPFDGRLSLTDEDGLVRVLGSLEEVVNFLATLEAV